jgi:hypothetical protein
MGTPFLLQFLSCEQSKPPKRVAVNSTRWFFAWTAQVTVWKSLLSLLTNCLSEVIRD